MIRHFARYCCVHFVAAEPEKILNRLSEEDIGIRDITWIDSLTVEFYVRYNQYSRTLELLNRYGISGCLKEKQGLLWRLTEMQKRGVLIVGVAFFLLMACLLRERILFIDIVGNVDVPDSKILYYAESAGIGFGGKSSSLRSEEIKNELLEKIPELQWVGITASGCVATIDVKERSSQGDESKIKPGISHVVARCDGVVTGLSVSRGTPVVQPGQSVKAGQMLISGYTDCDRLVKAQQAAGEVFAYTMHTAEIVTPAFAYEYGSALREHTCVRLRIGKKVINLCNHSGIPTGTCVKMYSEDYLTLPGGYKLPICVIKVQYTVHDADHEKADIENFDWAKEYALTYLYADMLAGEILGESLQVELQNGAYILHGEYACHEMIGQVKHEEITEQYAEDN